MADSIERDAGYGVRHPAWTEGLTGDDRPTISTTSIVRSRARWGLHSVVAFATTALVLAGLARSFSEPNRGVFARAFSDTPRTKVTVSGVMPSQAVRLSNYPDCTREQPTKIGKQVCWGRERFSR